MPPKATNRRRIGAAFSVALAIATVGVVGLLGLRSGPKQAAAVRTSAGAAHRAGDPDAPRRVEADAPQREADGGPLGFATQRYVERAYPAHAVRLSQVLAARRANVRILRRARIATRAAARGAARRLSGGPAASWEAHGPSGLPVPPSVVQNDGAGATTVSGRVTAMAVSPPAACNPGDCKAWIGAAGGGVWFTPDVLATHPTWQARSGGMASNAIGSLFLDTSGVAPVLYAGTGEGNGSSDSEAGVGLYRSSDDGVTWTLVPGSDAAARGDAILSIAVDPDGPEKGAIWIGTGPAVRGLAGTDGASVPPDAAPYGLFEETAGAMTFAPVGVVPSPTSSALSAGTVNDVVIDRTGLSLSTRSTVYAAVIGYGVFRSSPNLDADAAFRQVFATANPFDTNGDRTEIALTSTHLFVYDSSDDLWADGSASTSGGDLYRLDPTLTAANMAASAIQLSSPSLPAPGRSAYEACQNAQCFYDLVVASPPGQPDAVLIGGSFSYDDVADPHPPSNGRAVLYCANAGTASSGQVACRDMTADATVPTHAIHPDQHAIAFAGTKVIEGSDGGVVRFDLADLVDRHLECAGRGLSGGALATCEVLLGGIPHRIESLDAGLATLQLNSIALAPRSPSRDWLAGLQDNGTIARLDGAAWNTVAGGDGGLAGIDVGRPQWRVHSFFAPSLSVNFRTPGSAGYDTRWDTIAGPLEAAHESSAFYAPVLTDPVVSGTILVGLQHVWRTTTFGGDHARLDAHCNDLTGDYLTSGLLATCGDLRPIGRDLTGDAYGPTRLGGYVVAVARASSDRDTLWATTSTGRVFVSRNAASRNAGLVRFARLDTLAGALPNRTAPSISVDPAHAGTAYVGYSGYGSNTPGHRGHVYRVSLRPGLPRPVVADLSFDIGDQPIDGVAYDAAAGDLYAATDFGVLRLPRGSAHWQPAASALPLVAVADLRMDVDARVLVAATHGRGAYLLRLAPAGAPRLVHAARVVGSPIPGGRLDCGGATWSGATAQSAVMLRDGLPTGGASLRPRLADVGATIACRDTASASGGAANATLSRAVVIRPHMASLRSATRRVQSGPTVTVVVRVATLVRGRLFVERRVGRRFVVVGARRVAGRRRLTFSFSAAPGLVRLRLRFVPVDRVHAAIVIVPLAVRVR